MIILINVDKIKQPFLTKMLNKIEMNDNYLNIKKNQQWWTELKTTHPRATVSPDVAKSEDQEPMITVEVGLGLFSSVSGEIISLHMDK